MGERGLTAPKMFVSYSWSSPDHEDWVLRFATELSECGVDVILDKWDLKEGNDAHVFMEKMVTDPEIRKVVLVCDESYARKTDGRTGGVGTEAQIISSGVYSNQEQDKFVAVVVERDTEGKAYLPAYYRSRIYIDLSDSSIYGDGFEQLLRWIFDKPMYEKPELGSMPAFLSEADKTVLLATSARCRRFEAGETTRCQQLRSTSINLSASSRIYASSPAVPMRMTIGLSRALAGFCHTGTRRSTSSCRSRSTWIRLIPGVCCAGSSSD